MKRSEEGAQAQEGARGSPGSLPLIMMAAMWPRYRHLEVEIETNRFRAFPWAFPSTST